MMRDAQSSSRTCDADRHHTMHTALSVMDLSVYHATHNHHHATRATLTALSRDAHPHPPPCTIIVIIIIVIMKRRPSNHLWGDHRRRKERNITH
eukprot:44073-Prorocentrum_minimum.AAC.6